MKNLLIHCVQVNKYSSPVKPGEHSNEPKWMTVRLKHNIGLRKSIYIKMKLGQGNLVDQYNTLVRIVKKESRITKKNYEIKVANHDKTDPKDFFQIYKTKNRESIGIFMAIRLVQMKK